MGIVHKFQDEDQNFNWEEIVPKGHESEDIRGVSLRWLMGWGEEASYSAMRHFEVEPGGWTALHHRYHENGGIILRGKDEVLLDEKETEVSFADVVYIPPD